MRRDGTISTPAFDDLGFLLEFAGADRGIVAVFPGELPISFPFQNKKNLERERKGE